VKLPRTLAVILSPLLLTSCAAPLGPGYTIERQQILLISSPQSPGRVHIASTYRLKNTGNQDLASIRAALPLEFKNLRVTAAKTQLSPGPAEKTEHAAIVSVPFASPLLQKKKLELTLEFDLETSSDFFYFPYSGWFFELRPPEGFLARGHPRANKIDFTVRVPENYLVIGGGVARGSKKRPPRQGQGGTEREFRFRLREDDFDLFILGGPYREQQLHANGLTVIFWTAQPLDAALAQRAAEQLTRTVRVYEEAFGPRIHARGPVRIAHIPTTWRPVHPAVEAIFLSSFPHGALLNLDRVELERFFTPRAGPLLTASLDLALAEMWFTHLTTPDPHIGVLDLGLAAYAQQLARDAQGASQDRAAFLAREIQRFDTLLGGATDTPIISLRADASGAQLRPARQKAILFLFALEEKVGKEKLLAAVKRTVQALRGSTYGWSEMRSALEAESGQDLSELFRRWLTEPGIPDDFRKRYTPPQEIGK
jgi:hypothetical protein